MSRPSTPTQSASTPKRRPSGTTWTRSWLTPTRNPAELPTLKDVHNAVGLVLNTFQRTYSTLTGEHWALELVAIQYDWQAVFLQPWLVRPEPSWGV
jgi:hypothetical protein